MRHRLRSGRLVALRRGVFCSREAWDRVAGHVRLRHELEVRAALKVFDDAWVSHQSAAALHRMPLPTDWDTQVTLTRTTRDTGRRDYPGVRLRTAAVPPSHRTVFHGIHILAAARTALDIARTEGLTAGLVAADAGLRSQIMTPSDLATTVRGMAGWPGAADARLAAEYASGKRESPVESASFALFLRRGIVLPACNTWVTADRQGGIRSDFAWTLHRVLGEADGRVKYDDPWVAAEPSLWREKLRQERLEQMGFVVTRWTGYEVHRRPDTVIARLAERSQRAHEMYGAPLLLSCAVGTLTRRPRHALSSSVPGFGWLIATIGRAKSDRRTRHG